MSHVRLNVLGGALVWLSWVICCSLCLVAHDAHAEPWVLAGQGKGAWVVPTAMAVARKAHGDVREIKGAEVVELQQHEQLLVPIGVADWVEVKGERLRIGVGSGNGPMPDAIVWMPPVMPLYVPTWSSWRFLVVETAAETAHIEVRVLGAVLDPMSWHRLDQQALAVARAAHDGSASAVQSISGAEAAGGEAARIGRLLAFERAMLKDADPINVRRFLQRRWLEESRRERPLLRPFFVEAQVNVTQKGPSPAAATATKVEPNGKTKGIVLGENQTLLLEGADVDLVKLSIRGQATGYTRLRIFEGERFLTELEFDVPQRSWQKGEWTAARLRRALMPEGNEGIRVEVLRGIASVEVVGYRQADELLDGGLGMPKVRHPPLLQQRDNDLLSALAVALAARGPARKHALMAWMRAQRGPRSVWAKWIWLQHADFDEIEGAAQVFALWQQASALPAEHRDAIRRAAVARLAERFPGLGPLESWRPLASVTPSIDEEQANDGNAARLMLAALTAPLPDVLRPPTADAAERMAALSREPAFVEIAGMSWKKLAPWRRLEPELGVPVSTEWTAPRDAFKESGFCRASGANGLRWTRLESSEMIEVQSLGASHTLVEARGQPGRITAEAILRIDGVPFTVHTGAGLVTRVAVRPGMHRFEWSGLDPLLLRIPRKDEPFCNGLRETERWVALPGPVSFPIPQGSGMTALRVVVEPSSSSSPARLKVKSGKQTFDLWLASGGRGSFELPVGAEVDAVTLSSSEKLRVRVSARLAAVPKRIQRRGIRASAPTAPVSEQLLQRLAALSLELQSAIIPAEITRLRGQRAQVLGELGFTRLAATEAYRAHGDVLADDEHEEYEGLPDAVELPAQAGDSVALGLLPMIEPLPVHNPSPAFIAARQALDAGALPSEVLASFADRIGDSGDADALLLAVQAERAGLPAMAARAYANIGRVWGSAAAYKRAASLAADSANADASVEGALVAFVYARRAEALGADVSGVQSRLETAIAWQAPDRVENSAGSTWIASRHNPSAESTGSRVRRALLAAPANATLLGPGETLRTVLHEGPARTITVHGRCYLNSGPDEACTLLARLDGVSAKCLSPSELVSKAPPGHTSCALAIERGSHRLDLRLPEAVDAIGYATIHDPAQRNLEQTSLAQWFAAEDARPVRLAVAGPTVLRIRARVRPNSATSLSFVVTTAAGEPHSTQEFVHSTPLDAWAYRTLAGERDDDSEVSEAIESEVFLEQPGMHWLTLVSSERAWFRISAANAVDVPRPRASRVSAAMARGPTTDSFQASGELIPPELSQHSLAGIPVALNLKAGYVIVDRIDGDEDPNARYAELRAGAARELVPGRVWLSGSLFGRARNGQESMGFSLEGNLASRAWLPGAFVRANLARQAIEGRAGYGARALLGLSHSLPLDATNRITPWLALTLRKMTDAGDAPVPSEIDPDVYTPWSIKNPRTLTVAAELNQRPLVDTFLDHQIAAKTLPNLSTIDRVELSSALESLPGAQLWPRLAIELIASYRPTHIEREQDFLRLFVEPRFQLWDWVSHSGRWSVTGDVLWRLDVPRVFAERSTLSGSLFLGYEQFGNNGLADLPPSARRFSERLEEGSGRVKVVAPNRNPWRALEEP